MMITAIAVRLMVPGMREARGKKTSPRTILVLQRMMRRPEAKSHMLVIICYLLNVLIAKSLTGNI